MCIILLHLIIQKNRKVNKIVKAITQEVVAIAWRMTRMIMNHQGMRSKNKKKFRQLK